MSQLCESYIYTRDIFDANARDTDSVGMLA